MDYHNESRENLIAELNRMHLMIGKLKQEYDEIKHSLHEKEQALTIDYELYRHGIEGSTDGLWDWNIITNEVVFSPQWKAMLGYEAHEIGNLLNEWSSRVHPADLDRVTTVLNRHLNGETPFYSCEHRMFCKNGTIKWVLDEGKITKRDENGKPLRAVGTHKDITERKATEFNLNKRLKELDCHNRISEILSQSDLPVELVIQKCLAVLPDGWQFPELAEAAIIMRGETFTTDGFASAVATQSQDIQENGVVVGSVKVGYREGNQLPKENVFLPEESDLLLAISGRLWNFIEKKDHEKALKASEDRFKKMLENLHDVVYEVDEFVKIKYISPAIEKIIDFTPAEIIGRNFMDFVDVDPEFLSKRFVELRNNQQIESEYKIKSRNGDDRWIRLSTKAIFENDKFCGGYGTLIDLTDRKKMELELQKSEALYRSIILASPDTITITDLEGNIKLSSPQASKMFGYEGSDIFINQSILKFIDECDHEKAMTNLSKMFEGHFSGAADYTGIKSDGTRFDIEVNAQFIKDAEGNTLNLVFVTRDISERKKAEEKIRKLSRSVEQSPVSVVITNLDGKIEYANPKAIETTGYSFEELLGQNPRVLKSGETEATEYDNLWESISHGKQWKGIFHNKRKNGDLYWESSTIGPITDSNGKITHYLAIKEDITTRRETEAALLKSEARFRQIVDLSQTVIWEIDASGIITFANHLAEDIWGYTQEELIGRKNIIDLIPLEYQEAMMSEVALSLNGDGRVRHFEHQILRADGTIIWVSVNGTAIIENGQLVGFIGAHNDITEKKMAEEKIIQQNLRLSAIIAALPDMIFVSDRQGNYLEYYKSNSGELLIDHNSLVGKNVNDVFDEETSQLHIRMIQDCLDKNEVITYEYFTQTDKGNIYFEGRIASLGKDKVLRFVREITEKKTKDILIQKLSMAVEQSPVSIVITNLKSEIEYINHAFEISTGYTRDEVFGRKTNILKSGKTDPEIYKLLWDTISVGKNWSGEWINKRKNGDYYWENVSITPIYNEKGEIANYLAIKLDISQQKESERQIRELNTDLEQKIAVRTSQLAEINNNLLIEIEDRKQIEEELKLARKEAEQANIAKSEFLSRMSHELRTPMNSILGFAQLLQMGELSASQNKGVTHIMRSGRHLLDLINEVLDISRIEAGRLSLSLEPVLVSGVIEEIIDIVRPLATERNITINFDKAVVPKLFVKSDHQRIKQVLINLLNNSIKYNITGGNVDIKIIQMPPSIDNITPVRVTIKDTGLGIASDDLPKLFKPFERIGADKTATEGTGLGLAVVEKLTHAMGGKIGVESEVGKGSMFWIEMPQCIGPIEIADKSGELLNTVTQSHNKKGIILYIEDNTSNIELIEQIIEAQRSNIQLITNMTGRQTVQLALEYMPDLILLDLNLPDMHGSEVLENLQANAKTKDIPVVVISADAMPLQLSKLLKSGARNYITKPLQIVDFLKIVDEFIPE